MLKTTLLLGLGLSLSAAVFFPSTQPAEPSPLIGAWERITTEGDSVGENRSTWVFSTGYMSRTDFNVATKTFVGTRGGTYTHTGGDLLEMREFDTWNAENVYQEFEYEVELNDAGQLMVQGVENGKRLSERWQRIDDGNAPLAGAWSITQRMGQDGEMQEIHSSGTRKTVKLLSGSRFQWIAIDPGKAAFMGTGGGAYTFEGGKYTENIEFFSRDSSRVGMSLSFYGNVEGDDWMHMGKSSKGQPIKEVWSRN